MTTPKTPASESGKKAPASKGKQTASSKKAAKAAASDDGEESRAESKEPEKKMTQEEAKDKKEKESMCEPNLMAYAYERVDVLTMNSSLHTSQAPKGIHLSRPTPQGGRNESHGQLLRQT